MDTITECEQLVIDIGKKLVKKSDRLEWIGSRIVELQGEGVYDAIPAESWEGRNGGGKVYLRLVFPADAEGRRKEYVGADPDRVAAARENIARTRLLEALQAEERRIESRAVLAKAILQRALKHLDGLSVW